MVALGGTFISTLINWVDFSKFSSLALARGRGTVDIGHSNFSKPQLKGEEISTNFKY